MLMKNLVVLTVFVLGGVFFSCWAFADGSLGNVVELSEASHDSYNSGTDAAADTGSADTTDKDTTESTEPPATTTEKTPPPATTETTPPKTTEKTTPETTTPKTT
jgi:cytoskeletal protein RodZ